MFYGVRRMGVNPFVCITIIPADIKLIKMLQRILQGMLQRGRVMRV